MSSHRGSPSQGAVRVTGRLWKDAEMRMSHGRQPVPLLKLLIEKTDPDGLDWSAWQAYGTSNADQIAACRKANQLRRGMRVTVYATGAHPATEGGRKVLALTGVTDVSFDCPTPHHASAESADLAA